MLVEDHSIFIEGLESILQKMEGVQVVATFCNGQQALDYLQNQPVDLVFLDISLPGLSGIALCHTIHHRYRHIKIVALSNHTERNMINDMLEAGANGYLLKNASCHDLQNAIEQVLLGQCVMSEEIRQIVFSLADKKERIPRLTNREKEVLYWISEGMTTQTIANKLFVSIQTVETHRYNLLQKFEVPNSVTLVKRALELGVLKLRAPQDGK